MATRTSTRFFQTVELKLPLGVTSPNTVDLYYSKRANTLGEFSIKPLVILYADNSTVTTKHFSRFTFTCPKHAVDDLMQFIEANLPIKKITFNAYRDNEEFKVPVHSGKLIYIFEPDFLQRSLNYKKHYFGKDEVTGYWYSKNATTQSVSLPSFYKEETVPSTFVLVDEDKDCIFLNKTSKLRQDYTEKLLTVLQKFEMEWTATYNEIYNKRFPLNSNNKSDLGDIQQILDNYKQIVPF